MSQNKRNICGGLVPGSVPGSAYCVNRKCETTSRGVQTAASLWSATGRGSTTLSPREGRLCEQPSHREQIRVNLHNYWIIWTNTYNGINYLKFKNGFMSSLSSIIYGLTTDDWEFCQLYIGKSCLTNYQIDRILHTNYGWKLSNNKFIHNHFILFFDGIIVFKFITILHDSFICLIKFLYLLYSNFHSVCVSKCIGDHSALGWVWLQIQQRDAVIVNVKEFILL